MRRRTRLVFLTLAVQLLGLGFLRAAVPSTFTYQGSLKQSSVPVNGNQTIELRITNADGTQMYWTTGPRTVNVKEGLYRMELAPPLDWGALDPYIETKVNGTLLLPREKITSSITGVR